MNKKDIKDIPSDLIQQALVLFALKPLALADLPQSIHLKFPSLTSW
jgi:hypothetical protein